MSDPAPDGNGSATAAGAAIATDPRTLGAILDAVADPIIVIGLDYRVAYANAAAQRAHGSIPSVSAGCVTCHELTHRSPGPCDRLGHPCPLAHVRATGSPTSVVHRHEHASGEVRTYELAASPLRSADGDLIGIVEIGHDITDHLRLEESLRHSESRMTYLAHHDSLTGLPNRVLLGERVKRALARARRSGLRAAILFMDLDQFKAINDRFGHQAGDRALRHVAERLLSCLRESDTVARAGGDEFAFVIEQVGEIEQVAAVARKILDELATPLEIDGHSASVAGSIGAAIFPDHGDLPDELIRKADAAMYLAKARGGHAFALHRPTDEASPVGE